MSNLSDLLTSFLKKGMSKSLVFKKLTKKRTKSVPRNTIWIKFFEQIARFCEQKSECAIASKKWAIHSFALLCIMSHLKESLRVALLSWATWAICSRLLFCHEQPELTGAHLSWTIWANRSQSLIWSQRSERMSKFPTLKLHSSIFMRCLYNSSVL